MAIKEAFWLRLQFATKAVPSECTQRLYVTVLGTARDTLICGLDTMMSGTPSPFYQLVRGDSKVRILECFPRFGEPFRHHTGDVVHHHE